MTYMLTLESKGRESVLYVEDYAMSKDSFDVLIDGVWHFLKNIELKEVDILLDTPTDLFNNEILKRLEAE